MSFTVHRLVAITCILMALLLGWVLRGIVDRLRAPKPRTKQFGPGRDSKGRFQRIVKFRGPMYPV
jgi:hypothetical protein